MASETNPEGLLFRYEVLTYQHILSAFVSAWVTVEVLSKAWFYMSSFVLQHRKDPRSKYIAVTTLDINVILIQPRHHTSLF